MTNSRLPGFYKLDPESRYDKVLEATGIDDLEGLRTPAEPDLMRVLDGMIENVVGVIVGWALYERRFTVAEGQAALD